ncbi:MAG: hypothetical protein U9Q84_00955 [Thermodesulfobacteriota bacterium]|nr:hypothetical protein [Thermodesulfobacteriota bacterium]
MAYKALNKELAFSILFYREDNCVVAHCLELDIVAAGDSLKEVKKDIIALICAQIDYAFCHDNVENLYHPAPPDVWQHFFLCQTQEHERHQIHSMFNSPKKRIIPNWLSVNSCIVDQQACYV